MDRTSQYVCNTYSFNTNHNDFDFEKDVAEILEVEVLKAVTTAYPTLYNVEVSAYKDNNGECSVAIEAYNDCDIEAEYFEYNFCGQLGTQFDGYGIDGFIEPNDLDDVVENTIIKVLSEKVNATIDGEVECVIDGDDAAKVIEGYESSYDPYAYDDYMADHYRRDDDY